jgi:nitroimidazol reductase NimA-like FMN-containing flavoprotein (pyridoxamine 5'-phosphate oxidase superfamily)
MRELSQAEAMRRLGSVAVGRVVFTRHALPAIRPVNHLVDGGCVIIRSQEGSAIVSVARAGMGTVVAYEADAIDPASRTGWSVVVTGLARLVGEPERVARYQDLLQPWAAGHRDSVISIDAQVVTGFELIPDESPAPA